MKIEQKCKITNRVFRKADIKTLWQFVKSQKESSMLGTASITVKNNGETVTSNDDTIFESINFTHKDIYEIEIKYVSKNFDSRISINIETTNFTGSCNNYIEICGVSKDWVKSTYVQLQDIIKCVSKTPVYVRIFQNHFYVIIGGVSFILSLCFRLGVIPFIRMLTVCFYYKLAIFLVYIAFTLLCLWKYTDCIGDLPIVVIDVNEKYLEKQQKNIKRIWVFILSVLFPLILFLISQI